MMHLELFAGMGGFRLALGEKYVTIPFEYEKRELEVYNALFEESNKLQDVTKVNFDVFKGKIDVLTGGFPCQPFSSITNMSKTGTKLSSKLWQYPINIAINNHASFVMLENVPRFQNSPQFIKLVNKLKCYYNVAFGVLQGIDFCSPTRRKRLCILASVNHSVSELNNALKQKYELPLYVEDFILSEIENNTLNEKNKKITEEVTAGITSVHQLMYQGYSKKVWTTGIMPTITKSGYFKGSSGLALYPQMRLLSGLERASIHGFPIKNLNNFSNCQLFQVTGNSIVINCFKAVAQYLDIYK